MVILRNFYLNKLINHKNNGFIKIVSGVRRCGKSYLLFELFKKHLLSEGIKKDHIITIQLDARANKKFRNPDVCDEYVRSLIKDNKTYYLLLDEVQMMEDFESVLNGFLHINNLDVYVTGSNSKFLSTDIVTEFRGRGDEIRIYPLSFAEFYSAKKGDWDEAWDEYCTFGGMPAIFKFDTSEEKSKYLKNLYFETYLKDIINRNNVQNSQELEELLKIVASYIGGLTNPKKLADTFKTKNNNKLSLTAPTIKQYLDYFKDAFLINNVLRYDIKGKKYINTPSKYYFVDIGIRNALLNFRQDEQNHIMENIIYNELNVRGYNVDVGEVSIIEKDKDGNLKEKKLEVDFVINQGNKRYYVQSAYDLPTEEKKEQEKKSLLNIKDSFKKIVIVKGFKNPYYDDDGVMTIGLKNFLSDSKSLDFY